MFSCRLGNEHDTALSIVDPVQIQVELVGNSSYQNSSGLMDAFNSEDFPPILEVMMKNLWTPRYTLKRCPVPECKVFADLDNIFVTSANTKET